MSGAASDSAPAGQNRSGVAASGFDAFISYAHGDREFAARLRGALEELGKSVWMDEDGIPGGGRWKAELERAIESSHAFLFLASSASAASSECARELEYAVGLNKRILPVRAESTEPRGLPERLSEYQLIPAREVFTDDFDGSLKLLIGAIDSDPEWVHQHTEWGRRALEWDRQGRNQGFLLAGAALEAAERWRREAPGKQPAPSLLQGEYIDASRQAVTRRLRQTRAVIAGALLVAVALGVLAFVQRQIAVSNEHTAQSLRLAASADATLAQDPELSTLLALHALRTRETPQAVQALRNALPQLNVLATLRAGAAVNGATFSPDGKRDRHLWQRRFRADFGARAAANSSLWSRNARPFGPPCSAPTAASSSPPATTGPHGSGAQALTASSPCCANLAAESSTPPCSAPTAARS